MAHHEVMLSARNAWGPSPGPGLLVGSPTDIAPTGASAVAGWVLVVLIMIVRCSSAQKPPSGNFKKNPKVYYSQALRDTRHTRGHSARSQEEWERQWGRERERGVGVEDGFCRFTLYWWLENIRTGINVGRAKAGSLQQSIIWVTRGFSKGELHWWAAWLCIYLAV